MRKKIVRVLYVLLGLCFAALCLTESVLHVGTDEYLYYDLQLRAGVPEAAGISEDTLLRMDQWLAYGLEGRRDTDELSEDTLLQMVEQLAHVMEVDLDGKPNWSRSGGSRSLRMTVDGVEQDAFNEREIAHLQDCNALFATLRTLRQGLSIAVILLWLVAHIVATRWRIEDGFLACMGIGMLIFCVPIAVLGVWAAVDFSGAFDFFHRLLFTNDLWLLNPETDLLIRICPTSMFAGMGLRIALRAALPILGLPLLVYLLSCVEKRLNKRKQK